MNCNTCYIVCVILTAAAPVLAQPALPATAIPATLRPPTLDDVVDGRMSEWLRQSEFRQRDPNDGDPASEPTTAYLSHDRDFLYVAFVCRDRTPSAIRARLSKRDAIAQDDQVVVMLDTFHDRQRSYLFAANALGVQADAMATEGRDDDYNFDTVWRASGRRTADGYVVVMAIPFKSVRIAGAAGTWGIALSRIIPRNSEQSFWPYVTRRVEGLAQQFASIEQPASVTGARNIQVIPYAAASAGRYFDAATSRYNSPTDRRIGVDGKFVIRDAIALDVAINPDFSQVESDQPQVAVNQRFELYYPEKRPFFLENAAIFKFVRTAPSDPTTRNIPDMLFFSRRIQNPDAGARLTGKAGPWSFGAIASDDQGFTPAAHSRAVIAVGRVQREFSNQSTVGAFITSRERGVESNQVASLDWRWKFTPNWIFSGQAVASTSRLASGAAISGPAYNANLFYNSRKVLYSFLFSERDPSFRAALGFVPRTDITQIEQYGEYRWRPRSGPVVAFGPNHYVRFNWNHAGDLQEWIVRFPFEVHLKGRTQIFVRRVESSELFQGVSLRQHIQTFNVTTEWLKWLSINESYETGISANYFPPVGVQPSVAPSTLASLGLAFRPTPRLRLEQTYLYSSLEDVFSNHITRSTFNYQFTRELSMRVIADYNALHPNPAKVRSIHDERVAIDALVTYQTGPTTAIYVGYTSGYQNVLASEEGSAATRSESPSTLVGRQLFVKASYLIRR